MDKMDKYFAMTFHTRHFDRSARGTSARSGEIYSKTQGVWERLRVIAGDFSTALRSARNDGVVALHRACPEHSRGARNDGGGRPVRDEMLVENATPFPCTPPRRGGTMNNPVRKRGGTTHPSAFRAAYCRCIVENPCAARVQGGASCFPGLRSASLHLPGVIHRQPLRGLGELRIKN